MRGRSLDLIFDGLNPGGASAVGIVPFSLREVMYLKGYVVLMDVMMLWGVWCVIRAYLASVPSHSKVALMSCHARCGHDSPGSPRFFPCGKTTRWLRCFLAYSWALVVNGALTRVWLSRSGLCLITHWDARWVMSVGVWVVVWK